MTTRRHDVRHRPPARRPWEPVQIDGGPALVVRHDGKIDDIVAVRIDDGLITGLYVVRNPEKLSRIERETALHR